MGEKLVLFISHIEQEKDFAIPLRNFLLEKYVGSFDVFVSSDGESLPVGEQWLSKIDENLTRMRMQITLCSPYSVGRPWINFEAGAAWSKKIPLVPLCHSGMTKSELPVPLSYLQAVAIYSIEDFNILLKGVSKIFSLRDVSIVEKDKFWEEITIYRSTNKNFHEISNALSNIFNAFPDLKAFFLNGSVASVEVKVVEYNFELLEKNTNILQRCGMISCNFNKTSVEVTASGGVRFRGGQINLSRDYVSTYLPLLRAKFS